MPGTIHLPLWAEITVAVFAILSGLIALLAASGLLRLNSFFARVHAPAVITTVGIWCVMIAAIVHFSVQRGSPAINIMLIGLFISITTPVTTIFLMRAALFRARQRGEDVPHSISMLALAVPQEAPEEDDEPPSEGDQPTDADRDEGGTDDSAPAPEPDDMQAAPATDANLDTGGAESGTESGAQSQPPPPGETKAPPR
ncbi:hypothetical protein D8I35_02625 [Corticibacter populi]|uniref:Na+/H+ antiporter subunit G n=1 Tax=Corticibacter populi TaxID=1550736 RepID=A0A3M6QZJ2_9BURK|nr:hypothetical protein D8I35_02625 [Corticibacter populi]RZS35284.1 monovalent cation/proton antiporter MnhG/PhaG subunit [Corticibacter populi]